MGGGRGGIEEAATAKTLDIPERFKVVALMACVMCLCNADRVVMSVTVVPLASKFGWSTSFLGIVQVHPSIFLNFFFTLISTLFRELKLELVVL